MTDLWLPWGAAYTGAGAPRSRGDELKQWEQEQEQRRLKQQREELKQEKGQQRQQRQQEQEQTQGAAGQEPGLDSAAEVRKSTRRQQQGQPADAGGATGVSDDGKRHSKRLRRAGLEGAAGWQAPHASKPGGYCCAWFWGLWAQNKWERDTSWDCRVPTVISRIELSCCDCDVVYQRL